MRTATRPILFSLLIFWPVSHALGQFIVAHRGASFDAPENTMAAFHLAWERGADGVEGDFYLSSDGRVVCIHDKDTERVAGKKLLVAESTFAELRALEVGAWKDEKWRGEKVPSLEEVLACVPPGKMLFIELKIGPEIVPPLEKILNASSLRPEQTVIISFNAQTIEACEKRMPHLRSHWLTSYEKKEDGLWKPSAEKVAETVQRIGADGVGNHAKLEFVDKAFVEKYRAAGEDEFHVWTVNDVQVARTYQRLGAWSITTDRPGWLREQMQHAPRIERAGAPEAIAP